MEESKDEILKRLKEDAEGLGHSGDRSAIPVLLEVLEEPGAPLGAMALSALGHLDPRSLLEALANSDRYPGALHHRDFFARVLNTKHAAECVEFLVPANPTAPAVSPEAAAWLRERAGAAMFAPALARLSTAPAAGQLEQLAALLEALMDKQRAVQVAALRPALSTPLPAPENDALRQHRLAAIERLLLSACARFSIDPRALDAPAPGEQSGIMPRPSALRSGITPRPGAVTAADRPESGPESAPVTVPAARRLLPWVLALGCTALVAFFLIPAAPGPAATSAGGSRFAARKPVSLVGETGETIAVNGKLVDMDSARKVMNVMGPGGVNMSVSVPSALPGPIQPGARLRVVGTISDVASRKSVALEGKTVSAGP